MPKFKKRSIEIEAEQWFPGKKIDGVIIEIQSRRGYINTLEGKLYVNPGDWVVTGFIRFFKFEELWKEYRSTCELLRKEKHYFDFKIGDYNDSKSPDKVFVERVESLISSENNKWADINKGSAYSDH